MLLFKGDSFAAVAGRALGVIIYFETMKCLAIIFFFFLNSFILKGQTSDCLEPFSAYDTVSVNNNYVKYHVINKSATIEYGNNLIHRYLNEKYSCEIADARVPHFKWDNKDFIGLKFGCGSPCWGVMVLPLNLKDSVREILYNLDFDPKSNLIVYFGGENYDKLIVENLKTKSKQIIDVNKKKCDVAFIGYCIDSVSINSEELYYRFCEPNIFEKNKRMTEFRIKIK